MRGEGRQRGPGVVARAGAEEREGEGGGEEKGARGRKREGPSPLGALPTPPLRGPTAHPSKGSAPAGHSHVHHVHTYGTPARAHAPTPTLVAADMNEINWF